MNIDREILNIQDILQRADKDSEDIKSLLFASMALVKLKQVKTKYAHIESIASHGVAILNGVFGLNYTYHNENKILLFLWYLPVILYFAKHGFDMDKTKNILQSELNDVSQQHNALKNILRSTTPTQIHKIAKTYRDEIPDITDDTITPEQINQTIHHILMKYER
ncbi:MAG: hypothetical protein IKL95_03210 [Alphaproteobacteria bacterium]|nr:hypothetical protein [Alphaproteobacteria bacterium]